MLNKYLKEHRLIFTAIIALSLTACGGEETASENTEQKTEQTTADQTSAEQVSDEQNPVEQMPIEQNLAEQLPEIPAPAEPSLTLTVTTDDKVNVLSWPELTGVSGYRVSIYHKNEEIYVLKQTIDLLKNKIELPIRSDKQFFSVAEIINEKVMMESERVFVNAGDIEENCVI